MTGYRIVAACAALALVTGCNDGQGNTQKSAGTATAAAGAADCPDMPAAPPPQGEIRADQTMFGQPLKLPTPPPPVQAVLSVKCLPAGAKIGKHKHPWQRYVYLETGSLTVTWEAPVPQVKTFKAGDLLVESHDIWHSVQIGGDPVRLIVIDQVPATNPPTSNVIEWPGADEKAPSPVRR